MPNPRRWLRLDMDWEDSPWLDALDGTSAGCWPRVLCWVKRSGSAGRCRRPDTGVLARRWRVSVEAVDSLLAAALLDGALRIEADEWVLVNWAAYQEVDSTAAERKRRQRAKESDGITPITVTHSHRSHA